MTFSIIFDIIKYMKKLFIYGILAGFMFFFPACSGGKNYALLLWGLPEHNLQDLDIVPVYIKSNISFPEYILDFLSFFLLFLY